MRNHILPDDIDPVLEWKRETYVRYAAHHGYGIAKVMECNLIGDWRVTDGGKTVHEGSLIANAIEAYNSITAK